jgi:hypothetical protein
MCFYLSASAPTAEPPSARDKSGIDPLADGGDVCASLIIISSRAMGVIGSQSN